MYDLPDDIIEVPGSRSEGLSERHQLRILHRHPLVRHTHQQGDPTNAPGLSWHLPDHLTHNTVGYNALGIAQYIKDEPFSSHW